MSRAIVSEGAVNPYDIGMIELGERSGLLHELLKTPPIDAIGASVAASDGTQNDILRKGVKFVFVRQRGDGLFDRADAEVSMPGRDGPREVFRQRDFLAEGRVPVLTLVDHPPATNAGSHFEIRR